MAKLAACDANFLILDEPTNHLDLWACDALEQALREFDGTVLLVSHDRFFLNRVVDHLLVVEGPRFRVIEGNYDTYLHLVSQGLAGTRPPGGSGTAASTDGKSKNNTNKDNANKNSTEKSDPRKGKTEQPAKRKRKFPYRKVADLEAEIFERETNLEELQNSLATPEVHRDGNRIREVQAQIAEQQNSLATLYEHWEEATELN